MMSGGKKVALFVGDGMIAHAAVSPLIMKMCAMGIEPILYETGGSRSKKAAIPEFEESKFYETTLLKKTVIPYLNSSEILQDGQSKLYLDLCYSYEQLSSHFSFEKKAVPDVNDQDFVEELLSKPDLVGAISIRNYQIFSSDFIDSIQAKGFLWNLHSGLLPNYKGVFIPYRVLQNGDNTYGWTLHHIEPSIDTGNIIACCSLPITPDEPVLDIYLRMASYGVDLVVDSLSSYLLQGDIQGFKQADIDNSYYSFPTAEDMRGYKRKGIEFISSPKAVLDMYLSKFSISGSVHGQGLMSNLVSAIAEREQLQDSPLSLKILKSRAA